MDSREIEWVEMDWNDVAQNRDQWRAVVNTVMNLRIFSNLPNPSGRTMALGSTQPLTEMSTRNLEKETWG
jgi:hypothetical protein